MESKCEPTLHFHLDEKFFGVVGHFFEQHFVRPHQPGQLGVVGGNMKSDLSL